MRTAKRKAQELLLTQLGLSKDILDTKSNEEVNTLYVEQVDTIPKYSQLLRESQTQLLRALGYDSVQLLYYTDEMINAEYTRALEKARNYEDAIRAIHVIKNI